CRRRRTFATRRAAKTSFLRRHSVFAFGALQVCRPHEPFLTEPAHATVVSPTVRASLPIPPTRTLRQPAASPGGGLPFHVRFDDVSPEPRFPVPAWMPAFDPFLQTRGRSIAAPQRCPDPSTKPTLFTWSCSSGILSDLRVREEWRVVSREM